MSQPETEQHQAEQVFFSAGVIPSLKEGANRVLPHFPMSLPAQDRGEGA